MGEPQTTAPLCPTAGIGPRCGGATTIGVPGTPEPEGVHQGLKTPVPQDPEIRVRGPLGASPAG